MNPMARFPERALQRYADLILRHVYQRDGRKRYVPVRELEDELGLEPELILVLCRTRLLGEIQIADRLPAELEESVESQPLVERQWVRDWFAQPHLRVRPELVRLTSEELVGKPRKRKKDRKQRD